MEPIMQCQIKGTGKRPCPQSYPSLKNTPMDLPRLTIVNPNQSQTVDFGVHNAMGQLLVRGVVDEKFTPSTSEYAPGIYFLRHGNGSAPALIKR